MERFLKATTLAVVYSALIACDSTTQPETQDPFADPTKTNYSSSYCVSDDVTSLSDDSYILFDAFAIASDIPESIKNNDAFIELSNSLLYSKLIGSIGSIDLTMAFGPIFATGFCDAELSANNQCNNTIPATDNREIQTTGQFVDGVLSFESYIKPAGSSDTGHKTLTYSGDGSPYWQGSYTIYPDPNNQSQKQTVITWNRDQNTENFSSTSSNGNYVTATERSDCSGTISLQSTEDDGDINTVSGSWQLNGNTTTGQVTSCHNENCDSLSW